MISGYESREHVLAMLAALDAEVPKNEAHAASIAAQRELFQAEADRFAVEDLERFEREHETRLAAAKAGAAKQSRRR